MRRGGIPQAQQQVGCPIASGEKLLGERPFSRYAISQDDVEAATLALEDAAGMGADEEAGTFSMLRRTPKRSPGVAEGGREDRRLAHEAGPRGILQL